MIRRSEQRGNPTMTGARPRVSIFPKCYFDQLCRGEMDYIAWIRAAAMLEGEGLEHYDRFFRSLAPADVDPVLAAMTETGQVSSMLCFSPDFTHDDPTERGRQIERGRLSISRSRSGRSTVGRSAARTGPG